MCFLISGFSNHYYNKNESIANKSLFKWPHLNKDGKEDDCDDCGEEHVLCFIVRQKESQREGDCTPQATVGHDELVLFGQLHNAKFIYNKCETNNSWNTQKRDEISLTEVDGG